MATEASRVSTVVQASAAAVWQALTTASKLKQFFFGSDVITDWHEGSPIRFRGEWKGKPYEDKGVLETVQPERRLAFTHWSPLSGMADAQENYHVVSFDLAPHGGETGVTLTQTNRNDAEPLTDKTRAELVKNWTMVLDGLRKTAEGRDA